MTQFRARARHATLVALLSAVALLLPLPASVVAATQSLSSGTVSPAGTDASVESSVDGETWTPAEIAAPRAERATIPGTGWVTRSAPGTSVVFYRIGFTLPAEYSDPMLTVDVHADDMAMVFLNGTFLGMQSPGGGTANHQGDPDVFTASQGFQPGPNFLWFRVSTADGDQGVDFRATVTYGANQPPTADAGGPYVVAEGGSVGLQATATDPDGDDLAITWDLDGDFAFETSGATPVFSAAALDGPTSRVVWLRVCDPHAACVLDSVTLSVTNVAPTGTFVVPAAAADGTLRLTVTAAADPGPLDGAAGLEFQFDCGDGSGAGPVTVASAVTCPPGPLGPRAVSATIRDRDGASTTYTAATVVYGATPGGRFVIGDGSTAGTVTFWGAQWSRANTLSGGTAPAAFRGFASAPGAGCGVPWSAPSGAAAAPPSSVPAYIAVIVTSAAAKSALGVTGTTAGMVVVRTNPGYASKPGQAGTGTVVATIC